MRTTFTFVLVASLSMAAFGQTDQQKDKTYDPPAWAMIDDSLGHVLNLTNDQMKQVQQADDAYRTNVKSGDKSALDKRDKDLRAILMPSQFTQWQEIARKRQAKARR
jgi:hypothetical protein